MSRRRIHKHDVAKKSLAEAANYLASEANLDLALRFLDSAEQTFALLLTSPGIGHQQEFRDLRLRDLLAWPVSGFEKWLVFYRAVEDGIEVVDVMHGARNLEKRLGEKL